VIAVLFQHGRFDAASTAATAPVLAVYLAGAFPFAASTIVMRSFYAEQKMIFPMVTSTAIALASIPCFLAKHAARRHGHRPGVVGGDDRAVLRIVLDMERTGILSGPISSQRSWFSASALYRRRRGGAVPGP